MGEDFLVFEMIRIVDQHPATFPRLIEAKVIRVEADPGPGVITSRDLKAINDWLHLNQHVKLQDFQEMIRFGYRGLPFEEVAMNGEPAMQWSYPEWFCKVTKNQFEPEWISKRWVALG